MFAGSDSVGRYWQTRCLGFEVRGPDGEAVGIVEGLELDPGATVAREILVRRRGVLHSRLLRVRPYAVTLVDPWERSLVVTMPRRRGVPGARAAALARGRAAAAGSGLARAAAAGVAAARSGGKRLGSTAAVLSYGGLVLARRGAGAAAPRVAVVVGLGLWLYAVIMFRLADAGWRLARAVARGAARIAVAVAPPVALAAQTCGARLRTAVRWLRAAGGAGLRRAGDRVAGQPARRAR